MPIRDKSLYPPNWRDISHYIRFVRAGGKCEECGVAHGAYIVRSVEDPSRYLLVDEMTDIHHLPDGSPIKLSELPSEFCDGKYVHIVLTTAHLDHDPMNNDESNLKSLCQRCHLRYDAKHHAKNAVRTRRRKRLETHIAAGNTPLFEELR